MKKMIGIIMRKDIAVDGPVVSVSREEVLQALNDMKSRKSSWSF